MKLFFILNIYDFLIIFWTCAYPKVLIKWNLKFMLSLKLISNLLYVKSANVTCFYLAKRCGLVFSSVNFYKKIVSSLDDLNRICLPCLFCRLINKNKIREFILEYYRKSMGGSSSFYKCRCETKSVALKCVLKILKVMFHPIVNNEQ